MLEQFENYAKKKKKTGKNVNGACCWSVTWMPRKHDVEGKRRVKSFWVRRLEEEEGGVAAKGRGQQNFSNCEGMAWDFCSLVEKNKGSCKGETQLGVFMNA